MIVRSVLTSRHFIFSLAASRRLLKDHAEHQRRVSWALIKGVGHCRSRCSAISEEPQNSLNLSKTEAAPPDIQEELRKLGFGSLPLGEFSHIECPKCGGGDSGDKDLTLKVTNDALLWKCFRGKCGWKGGINFEGSQEYFKETSGTCVILQ